MRTAFYAAALTAVICSECFAEIRLFRRRTSQVQQQKVLKESPVASRPAVEQEQRRDAVVEKPAGAEADAKPAKKPAPRLRD